MISPVRSWSVSRRRAGAKPRKRPMIHGVIDQQVTPVRNTLDQSRILPGPGSGDAEGAKHAVFLEQVEDVGNVAFHLCPRRT